MLYLKHRPKLFKHMVGQESIVDVLLSHIRANKPSHAYLFIGTRGVGKTSNARVFAKALNCENPQDGEPCLVCPSCKEYDEDRAMDFIEIDAASNSGVDNIRKIIEDVKTVPFRKKKVYIIDEAHMLSIGANNALLKTLEEPPKNVVFILATTEADKIPATIISRCQRFNFKKISTEVIFKQLKEVVDAEHVSAEDGALELVAQLADGSMRDGLSILDSILCDHITTEYAQEALGVPSTRITNSILNAIVDKNADLAVKLLKKVSVYSDLRHVLDRLMCAIRDCLISKLPDGVAIEGLESLYAMPNAYLLWLNEQIGELKKVRYVGLTEVEVLFLKLSLGMSSDVDLAVIKAENEKLKKDVEYLINRNLSPTAQVDNTIVSTLNDLSKRLKSLEQNGVRVQSDFIKELSFGIVNELIGTDWSKEDDGLIALDEMSARATQIRGKIDEKALDQARNRSFRKPNLDQPHVEIAIQEPTLKPGVMSDMDALDDAFNTVAEEEQISDVSSADVKQEEQVSEEAAMFDYIVDLFMTDTATSRIASDLEYAIDAETNVFEIFASTANHCSMLKYLKEIKKGPFENIEMDCRIVQL